MSVWLWLALFGLVVVSFNWLLGLLVSAALGACGLRASIGFLSHRQVRNLFVSPKKGSIESISATSIQIPVLKLARVALLLFVTRPVVRIEISGLHVHLRDPDEVHQGDDDAGAKPHGDKPGAGDAPGAKSGGLERRRSVDAARPERKKLSPMFRTWWQLVKNASPSVELVLTDVQVHITSEARLKFGKIAASFAEQGVQESLEAMVKAESLAVAAPWGPLTESGRSMLPVVDCRQVDVKMVTDLAPSRAALELSQVKVDAGDVVVLLPRDLQGAARDVKASAKRHLPKLQKKKKKKKTVKPNGAPLLQRRVARMPRTLSLSLPSLVVQSAETTGNAATIFGAAETVVLSFSRQAHASSLSGSSSEPLCTLHAGCGLVRADVEAPPLDRAPASGAEIQSSRSTIVLPEVLRFSKSKGLQGGERTAALSFGVHKASVDIVLFCDRRSRPHETRVVGGVLCPPPSEDDSDDDDPPVPTTPRGTQHPRVPYCPATTGKIGVSAVAPTLTAWPAALRLVPAKHPPGSPKLPVSVAPSTEPRESLDAPAPPPLAYGPRKKPLLDAFILDLAVSEGVRATFASGGNEHHLSLSGQSASLGCLAWPAQLDPVPAAWLKERDITFLVSSEVPVGAPGPVAPSPRSPSGADGQPLTIGRMHIALVQPSRLSVPGGLDPAWMPLRCLERADNPDPDDEWCEADDNEAGGRRRTVPLVEVDDLRIDVDEGNAKKMLEAVDMWLALAAVAIPRRDSDGADASPTSPTRRPTPRRLQPRAVSPPMSRAVVCVSNATVVRRLVVPVPSDWSASRRARSVALDAVVHVGDLSAVLRAVGHPSLFELHNITAGLQPARGTGGKGGDKKSVFVMNRLSVSGTPPTRDGLHGVEATINAGDAAVRWDPDVQLYGITLAYQAGPLLDSVKALAARFRELKRSNSTAGSQRALAVEGGSFTGSVGSDELLSPRSVASPRWRRGFRAKPKHEVRVVAEAVLFEASAHKDHVLGLKVGRATYGPQYHGAKLEQVSVLLDSRPVLTAEKLELWRLTPGGGVARPSGTSGPGSGAATPARTTTGGDARDAPLLLRTMRKASTARIELHAATGRSMARTPGARKVNTPPALKTSSTGSKDRKPKSSGPRRVRLAEEPEVLNPDEDPRGRSMPGIRFGSDAGSSATLRKLASTRTSTAHESGPPCAPIEIPDSSADPPGSSREVSGLADEEGSVAGACPLSARRLAACFAKAGAPESMICLPDGVVAAKDMGSFRGDAVPTATSGTQRLVVSAEGVEILLPHNIYPGHALLSALTSLKELKRATGDIADLLRRRRSGTLNRRRSGVGVANVRADPRFHVVLWVRGARVRVQHHPMEAWLASHVPMLKAAAAGRSAWHRLVNASAPIDILPRHQPEAFPGSTMQMPATVTRHSEVGMPSRRGSSDDTLQPRVSIGEALTGIIRGSNRAGENRNSGSRHGSRHGTPLREGRRHNRTLSTPGTPLDPGPPPIDATVAEVKVALAANVPPVPGKPKRQRRNRNAKAAAGSAADGVNASGSNVPVPGAQRQWAPIHVKPEEMEEIFERMNAQKYIVDCRAQRERRERFQGADVPPPGCDAPAAGATAAGRAPGICSDIFELTFEEVGGVFSLALPRGRSEEAAASARAHELAAGTSDAAALQVQGAPVSRPPLTRIREVGLGLAFTNASVRVAGCSSEPMLYCSGGEVSGPVIVADQATPPPQTEVREVELGTLLVGTTEAALKGTKAPPKVYTGLDVSLSAVSFLLTSAMYPALAQLSKAIVRLVPARDPPLHRGAPPPRIERPGVLGSTFRAPAEDILHGWHEGARRPGQPRVAPTNDSKVNWWDNLRYRWCGTTRVRATELLAGVGVATTMDPHVSAPEVFYHGHDVDVGLAPCGAPHTLTAGSSSVHIAFPQSSADVVRPDAMVPLLRTEHVSLTAGLTFRLTSGRDPNDPYLHSVPKHSSHNPFAGDAGDDVQTPVNIPELFSAASVSVNLRVRLTPAGKDGLAAEQGAGGGPALVRVATGSMSDGPVVTLSEETLKALLTLVRGLKHPPCFVLRDAFRAPPFGAPRLARPRGAKGASLPRLLSDVRVEVKSDPLQAIMASTALRDASQGLALRASSFRVVIAMDRKTAAQEQPRATTDHAAAGRSGRDKAREPGLAMTSLELEAFHLVGTIPEPDDSSAHNNSRDKNGKNDKGRSAVPEDDVAGAAALERLYGLPSPSVVQPATTPSPAMQKSLGGRLVMRATSLILRRRHEGRAGMSPLRMAVQDLRAVLSPHTRNAVWLAYQHIACGIDLPARQRRQRELEREQAAGVTGDGFAGAMSGEDGGDNELLRILLAERRESNALDSPRGMDTATSARARSMSRSFAPSLDRNGTFTGTVDEFQDAFETQESGATSRDGDSRFSRVASTQGDEAPGSSLSYEIEVLQPQINFEGESDAGRLLLTASSGSVVGRAFHLLANPDAWNGPGKPPRKRTMSIVLEKVQAHTVLMDVDPEADLQWMVWQGGQLTPTLQGRAFMDTMFHPCSMQMNVTTLPRPTNFFPPRLMVELASQPRKAIEVIAPGLKAEMANEGFQIFLGVVNAVFLDVAPSALSMQFNTAKELAEEFPELQGALSTLTELRHSVRHMEDVATVLVETMSAAMRQQVLERDEEDADPLADPSSSVGGVREVVKFPPGLEVVEELIVSRGRLHAAAALHEQDAEERRRTGKPEARQKKQAAAAAAAAAAAVGEEPLRDLARRVASLQTLPVAQLVDAWMHEAVLGAILRMALGFDGNEATLAQDISALLERARAGAGGVRGSVLGCRSKEAKLIELNLASPPPAPGGMSRIMNQSLSADLVVSSVPSSSPLRRQGAAGAVAAGATEHEPAAHTAVLSLLPPRDRVARWESWASEGLRTQLQEGLTTIGNAWSQPALAVPAAKIVGDNNNGAAGAEEAIARQPSAAASLGPSATVGDVGLLETLSLLESFGVAPALQGVRSNLLDMASSVAVLWLEEQVVGAREACLATAQLLLRVMEQVRKSAKKELPSMRLSFTLNHLHWELMKEGKAFVDIEIDTMDYTMLRDQRQTANMRMSIHRAEVRDRLGEVGPGPDMPPGAILQVWNPTSAWERDELLRVVAMRGQPTPTHHIYEHLEVLVHPLGVHLTESVAKGLVEFFLPGSSDADDGDDEEKAERLLGALRVKVDKGSRGASVDAPRDSKDLTSLWSEAREKEKHRNVMETLLQKIQKRRLKGPVATKALPGPTPVARITDGRGIAGASAAEAAHGKGKGGKGHARKESAQEGANPAGSTTGAADALAAMNTVAAAGAAGGAAGKRAALVVEMPAVADDFTAPSGRAQKRKLFLKHVRFNRVYARVSYEGGRMPFLDLKLLLDSVVYQNIDTKWGSLFSRYKFAVLRSVLKSVTGLQNRKFHAHLGLSFGKSKEVEEEGLRVEVTKRNKGLIGRSKKDMERDMEEVRREMEDKSEEEKRRKLLGAVALTPQTESDRNLLALPAPPQLGSPVLTPRSGVSSERPR
ncbi:unnamed protein product [Pedinophyceae sp. YPF-701]|nr:unnamed protein product [Pedinophyceae sp. YPF-701]